MDIELLETLFKQIMEENKKERVNEYDSEIEIETVYKDWQLCFTDSKN